jgi:hypothetical protein
MPYLAMVDRLKAFFRHTNPLLICCGYSFADDHLNEVLIDGLRVNRSAQCFAMQFGSLAANAKSAALAKRQSNLTVLAEDGAVVALRPGGYLDMPAGSAQAVCGSGLRTGAPSAADKSVPVFSTLGDFHHFGLFLENNFGIRLDHERH